MLRKISRAWPANSARHSRGTARAQQLKPNAWTVAGINGRKSQPARLNIVHSGHTGLTKPRRTWMNKIDSLRDSPNENCVYCNFHGRGGSTYRTTGKTRQNGVYAQEWPKANKESFFDGQAGRCGRNAPKRHTWPKIQIKSP